MDQNVAALVPLLPGYFGWNLTRTKCLASLIIVLIKVRTANFAQLATALPGGALLKTRNINVFNACSEPFLSTSPPWLGLLFVSCPMVDPGSDQLEIRSNQYQYSVLGDHPAGCGDPRVIDPVR